MASAGAAAADELVAQGIAAAAAAVTADEPVAEQEAKACAWCSATENLKRCGGCRKKWFCDNGKKCLKEAWTKGGHKQECKATQRASTSKGDGSGPKSLPAAMKTVPKWVQGPPASESEDFRGPQMSDSFDQLPLDEEDECAICMGDPMSRSGQGVVALECSHRFHRDCVAALRSRKVACPCTSCDAGVAESFIILMLAVILNIVRSSLALCRSSGKSNRSAQAGTTSTKVRKKQWRSSLKRSRLSRKRTPRPLSCSHCFAFPEDAIS
jgi:hypothetical protein